MRRGTCYRPCKRVIGSRSCGWRDGGLRPAFAALDDHKMLMRHPVKRTAEPVIDPVNRLAVLDLAVGATAGLRAASAALRRPQDVDAVSCKTPRRTCYRSCE